jgi:hypothetical protein
MRRCNDAQAHATASQPWEQIKVHPAFGPDQPSASAAAQCGMAPRRYRGCSG